MPRMRFVKHEFFLDDALAAKSALARLLFIGLWTLADREGRLIDNPAKIRAQLFPYEAVDVASLLQELAPDFIHRYEVDGKPLIQVKNFAKHQRPHHKEPKSDLPAYRKQQSPGKTGASPGQVVMNESSKVPFPGGSLVMGNGSLVTDTEHDRSFRARQNERGLGMAFSKDFMDFWNAYHPLRRINQSAASREWDNLGPDLELKIQIMGALANQKALWQAKKTELDFIPHPASWLRDRRWTDVLDTLPPVDAKPKPCPRCRISGPNNRPTVKAKDGTLICDACANEEAVLNGE
jgi:hypothetical protein